MINENWYSICCWTYCEMPDQSDDYCRVFNQVGGEMFYTFSSGVNDYLWFATNTLEGLKSEWFVNSSTNGAIGVKDPSGLFGSVML